MLKILGNVILTDHEYTILNVLRPRTDKDTDVRFVVKEKYPLDLARQYEGPIPEAALKSALESAKSNENLKKILTPLAPYGPALIEDCLLGQNILINEKIGNLENFQGIFSALKKADEKFCEIFLGKNEKFGEILCKKEENLLETYVEFHPISFRQFSGEKFVKKIFPNFNRTVDEFFSKLETQKLDQKAAQAEKTALKKLENIRKDHETRVAALEGTQTADQQKAQFIEMNEKLIEKAQIVIQSALANQIPWDEIEALVSEA